MTFVEKAVSINVMKYALSSLMIIVMKDVIIL
jgi:hypothetical protein